MAAVTLWYDFYHYFVRRGHYFVRRGRYTYEIGQMHERYGPIVRISPHELHIKDPKYIDQVYTGGSVRRDKYPFFTRAFGMPDSVFCTIGHDHHRLRRSALNRFFSKASVTKLEPLIHDAVEKLCKQLDTYSDTGRPVQANNAFRCLTTDIVTEYAFAKSYGFLDLPTFEPNLHDAPVAGTMGGLLIKHFPWLFGIMESLPPKVLTYINPSAMTYFQFQEEMRRQVNEVQKSIRQSEKTSGPGRTIFHKVLTGDLPAEEKRLERLWQEAEIVVGAGTETTAWTLSVVLFYVLNDDEILRKLRQELEQGIPDPDERVRCSHLEQLPYLSAVICEALRLSYGLTTRSARVNPVGPLVFKPQPCYQSFYPGEDEKEWVISRGTPVGMTSLLIHANETLFPDHLAFRPERWLDESGKRHRDLDKYLISFSRGSRQCIDINLAYAELYLGLGLLVRRMGHRLKLFERTKADVEVEYDRTFPTVQDGTKGIWVLVAGGDALIQV